MAVSPRLRKIRETLTQVVRKHFGKKNLKFNSPEPHYNFFKRLMRSIFRKQSSVNKAIIATLRSQERWDEQMEARMAHAEAHIRQIQDQPCAPATGYPSAVEARNLTRDGQKVLQILNSARGL